MADCETSIVSSDDAQEEFLALAGGLLQAGATRVIGGLWELADISALLCSRRFYQFWLATRRASEALAHSQSWLRGLTVRQMLSESEVLEVLTDCYRMEYGEDASSPTEALKTLLGEPVLDPDSAPFASPFFWAPFRCIGLP